MPRKNLSVDGKISRQSKVRKRGCCSSSSSSSLVRRSYRLKRAVLVGKKGGSSTPVPTWKMSSSKSPSVQHEKSLKFLQAKVGVDKGRDLSVSARKLAATLWEINGVSRVAGNDDLEEKRSQLDLVTKEKIFKSSKLGCSLAQDKHFSDPSHSPLSEGMTRSKIGSHRRRTSIGSQKLLVAESNLSGFSSHHNAGLMEVDQTESHGKMISNYMFGVKNRLKDVKNGLTTSKELLKVLYRTWGMEAQHSTSSSLFSALKAELDRACIQVNKLIQEQRVNCSEIDLLLKKFDEEKGKWKTKERERVHIAVTSVAGELETEKKLRRQTERLNKKLGKELADTKTCLARAVKELENEKRAREVLEQVCDELARGIGEDRAAVEELKKQSEKVREEVEKEREMLQLADVLREERVQMKLSEARYQFEEKNAAVDKLRSELEAYLSSKRVEEPDGGSPNYGKIKELERHLRETLSHSCHFPDNGMDHGEVFNKEKDDEDEAGDDSADSDLHSIELNMDGSTKTYEWTNAAKSGSRRPSVDDKNKARRSNSERIQRQRLSLERETSDGIEWDFTSRGKENSDVFDREGLFEFTSQGWRKDCDDEIQRYNMIKDLRDHVVSATRVAPSQDYASPTKTWSQKSMPSQDPNQVLHEGFAVLQGAG